MSNRAVQLILIASMLMSCWLGMQAVHELGHVSAAWMTGGRVANVALHPAAFSRTDLAENPHPLAVAWAGPLFGVSAPLALWGASASLRLIVTFLLRFFAGFCLIANGLYLGVGSFDGVGDCGELLRHGAPIWQLWLFGASTTVAGLLLWHRQGKYFGWGPSSLPVSRAYAAIAICTALALIALGLWIGD